MRYSNDLRKRVLEFIEEGGGKSQAARRFRVSRASIYNWLNMDDASVSRRTGPREPMTQAERAHHFKVSRHCIWYNLRKLKISRKKNDSLHAV